MQKFALDLSAIQVESFLVARSFGLAGMRDAEHAGTDACSEPCGSEACSEHCSDRCEKR